MSGFSGKDLLLLGTGGVKRRTVLEALRALSLRRVTFSTTVPTGPLRSSTTGSRRTA